MKAFFYYFKLQNITEYQFLQCVERLLKYARSPTHSSSPRSVYFCKMKQVPWPNCQQPELNYGLFQRGRLARHERSCYGRGGLSVHPVLPLDIPGHSRFRPDETATSLDVFKSDDKKSCKRIKNSSASILVHKLSWSGIHEGNFLDFQKSLFNAVFSDSKPRRAMPLYTDAFRLYLSGMVTEDTSNNLRLHPQQQKYKPLAFPGGA